MSSPIALSGIRVLDLSRLLPGPFCTLLLADLGAEIIKVEEPGKGDYSRHYSANIDGIGINFLSLNRGKKSVTLNLKHSEGPGILKKLASGADVLLEGFRPGVMDRLGVGFEALSSVNPRLIYCSLTGYGQTGPYRDYPGHDINYMGYAGASSLTGRRGEDPRIPGVQVADIGGGALMAAFSILAAIIARERTGRGQYLDVAMMDGVAFLLGIHLAAAARAIKDPSFLEMAGEKHAAGGMRLNGGRINCNIYRTKDGRFVTLGALEEKFWRNFCAITNRTDLIDKANAKDKERDALEEELRTLFSSRTFDDWMKLLAKQDVCFGPVNSLAEALNDPHLKARGMFVEVPLPGLPGRAHVPARGDGTMTQVAFPVKFSGTPPSGIRPSPLLGQHNDEIYPALGYTVSELHDKGII